LVIQFQAVQFQYAATTGVWYSTAVHGVAATAATANTLAARDTNIYLTARGFIPGFTTTSTAAGTTTLTIASNSIQEFTGSSTQTVVLPTTSVVAGQQWAIINNSTGAVAVQSSSLAALHTVAPGTEAIFTALIANPTTAAHWEDSFFGTNFAAGKKLTVNNTMTLSGTDGTTFAFPSTDATVARTDAAQTFTGIQTMTSPALTTPAITGAITGTYSFGGTPTGLPVSAITASTSTALGVGSVELGHATDTTLTRSAAGVLAVEGFDVQTKSVVSVTGTTTLGAVAGREYIVLLGSGAVATLPTAVSNTSIYHLKNVHTASLTVAVTSSQTIDGGTGSITVLPQQCYSLVSNGTNWVII
jgi:hypothetical protein